MHKRKLREKKQSQLAKSVTVHADDDDVGVVAVVGQVVERQPQATAAPKSARKLKTQRPFFLSDRTDDMKNSIAKRIGVKDAGNATWDTIELKLNARHSQASSLSAEEQMRTREDNRVTEGKPDEIETKMLYDIGPSRRNVGQINGMKFEILLERTIREQSVCRVFSSIEWDKRNEQPFRGGLLDERMGALDRVISHDKDGRPNPSVCKTCEGLSQVDRYRRTKIGEPGDCTGHPGHIEVPGAIFNVMTVANVKYMLHACCWICGKLPGKQSVNNKNIEYVQRHCNNPFDTLVYLGKAYEKERFCHQCQAARRCENCPKSSEIRTEGPGRGDSNLGEQCNDCKTYVCFRPRLRTLRQMENDEKRTRKEFDNEFEDHDVNEDDDEEVNRRDAIKRGARYSGFPYEAILNGNAGTALEDYANYARSVYPEDATYCNVLILHGERVRKIIQRMSPDFLQLFLESTYDSIDRVRQWFKAFAARSVVCPEQQLRPTQIVAGGDESEHMLNDLSRRFRTFMRHVVALTTKLNPASKHDERQRGTFYKSIDQDETNWFDRDPEIDFVNIQAYAEIQFYYARIISQNRSTHFLPHHLQKRGVGSGAKNRSSLETAVTAESSNSNSDGSLENRLHAKGGRFRQHLMAKRGEFNARDVITGDPTIGVGEVIIPIYFSTRLSISESINSLNVVDMAIKAERMRRNMLEGVQRTHPNVSAMDEVLYMDEKSAFCMFNADCDDRIAINNDFDTRKKTADQKRSEERPLYRHPYLNDAGARVERNLQEGDGIICNRQPTLHEQSMMYHDAVIIDPSSNIDTLDRRFVRPNMMRGLTTRYNTNITTPYNADFDGDEMTMTLPQGSLQTRVESQIIMCVPEKIISTSNEAPCFGLKQDSATSVYDLTSKDTFLTRDEFMQYMYAALQTRIPNESKRHTFGHNLQLPTPAILFPKQLWTGKQVMKFTWPEEFTYWIDDLSPVSLDYPTMPPPKNRNDKEEMRDRMRPKTGVKFPVLIYKGELMYGQLDSRCYGPTAGAITQALVRRVLEKKDVILAAKEAIEKRLKFPPTIKYGAGVNTNLNAVFHADKMLARREACWALDRASWIGIKHFDRVGFSTGLDDCMVDKSSKMYRDAQDILLRCCDDVDSIIAMRGTDEMAKNNSDIVSETERRILKRQGDAFSELVECANRGISASNSIARMYMSGGKGKPENITMIALGVCGQQLEMRRVIDSYRSTVKLSNTNAASGADHKRDRNEIETAMPLSLYRGSVRMTKNITDRKVSFRSLDSLDTTRFLPHMKKGIYPDCRNGGFIVNSYISGLTPQEFFFHAQAAREGLLDTAVKTQDTGSEQRLAMKSCEDVGVTYDGTVRNCANEIVSTFYGDTGCDPKKLEKKRLEFLSMRDADLRDNLFYDDNDECLEKARGENHDDYYALANEASVLRSSIAVLRELSCREKTGSRIITPGNLQYTIVELLDRHELPLTNAMHIKPNQAIRWHYTPTTQATFDALRDAELNPSRNYTAHMLQRYKNNVVIREGKVARIIDDSVKSWVVRGICDMVMAIEIRLRLCSKQVTRRYAMTEACFMMLIDCLERLLYDSRVPAGEAVGALMVTSVGQPATQMTLNTFHMTGKANVGVISGLPRMQEVSHVTATNVLKGLKVVVWLHENSFIFRLGQRQRIASTLYQRTGSNKPQKLFETSEKVFLEKLMTRRRLAAQNTLLESAKNVVRTVARHSRFGERQRGPMIVRQRPELQSSIGALFSAIDNLTGTPTAPSKVECTLDYIGVDWRTRSFASLGWQPDGNPLNKINTVLTFQIAANVVEYQQTTPVLIAESVWRSVLPFVTNDVDSIRHFVVEDNNMLVIGVFGCSESTESAIYDSIRTNRFGIFVDIIGANDMEHSKGVFMQQLYLEHHPGMDVSKCKGEEVVDVNFGLLRLASGRKLLRNLISIHVIDLHLAHNTLVQPLIYNEETKRISVQFDENARSFDGKCSMVANSSERQYFSDGYIVPDDDFYCTNPECQHARATPNHPRHKEARIGCQSASVAVFWLDAKWFRQYSMDPYDLERSIAAKLQSCFYVKIGDYSCYDYIPLHIRAYTCRTPEELKPFISKRFADISHFDFSSIGLNAPLYLDDDNDNNTNNNDDDDDEDVGDQETVRQRQRREHRAFHRLVRPSDIAAIDALPELSPTPISAYTKEQAIMDNVTYLVLAHHIVGATSGTSAMLDDESVQIFTPEKGFEERKQSVLTCNSADFHHLLALRGTNTAKMYSNSMHDMCDAFGIEAGRDAIIREYGEVLRDKSYVNRSHLACRADIQTRHGRLVPLTHDGLRSARHDVIQSASHRENAKMMVLAALRGNMIFPLISPSSCVAAGVPLRTLGTGIVELIQCTPSEKEFIFEQPEPGDVLTLARNNIAAMFGDEATPLPLEVAIERPNIVNGIDLTHDSIDKRAAEVIRNEAMLRMHLQAQNLPVPPEENYPHGFHPALFGLEEPVAAAAAIAAPSSPVQHEVFTSFKQDAMHDDADTGADDDTSMSLDANIGSFSPQHNDNDPQTPEKKAIASLRQDMLDMQDSMFDPSDQAQQMLLNEPIDYSNMPTSPKMHDAVAYDYGDDDDDVDDKKDEHRVRAISFAEKQDEEADMRTDNVVGVASDSEDESAGSGQDNSDEESTDNDMDDSVVSAGSSGSSTSNSTSPSFSTIRKPNTAMEMQRRKAADDDQIEADAIAHEAMPLTKKTLADKRAASPANLSSIRSPQYSPAYSPARGPSPQQRKEEVVLDRIGNYQGPTVPNRYVPKPRGQMQNQQQPPRQTAADRLRENLQLRRSPRPAPQQTPASKYASTRNQPISTFHQERRGAHDTKRNTQYVPSRPVYDTRERNQDRYQGNYGPIRKPGELRARYNAVLSSTASSHEPYDPYENTNVHRNRTSTASSSTISRPIGTQHVEEYDPEKPQPTSAPTILPTTIDTNLQALLTDLKRLQQQKPAVVPDDDDVGSTSPVHEQQKAQQQVKQAKQHLLLQNDGTYVDIDAVKNLDISELVDYGNDDDDELPDMDFMGHNKRVQALED